MARTAAAGEVARERRQRVDADVLAASGLVEVDLRPERPDERLGTADAADEGQGRRRVDLLDLLDVLVRDEPAAQRGARMSVAMTTPSSTAMPTVVVPVLLTVSSSLPASSFWGGPRTSRVRARTGPQ